MLALAVAANDSDVVSVFVKSLKMSTTFVKGKRFMVLRG